MGSASGGLPATVASAALQLPVRLRGIQLGRPTDLLLDVGQWQALGFVVRCGDTETRFLPYAACKLEHDELRIASPLMLLEESEFYERRGTSFRSLLGGDVAGGGVLRDVVLGPRGEIAELVVEREGSVRHVRSAGVGVSPTRAPVAS